MLKEIIVVFTIVIFTSCEDSINHHDRYHVFINDMKRDLSSLPASIDDIRINELKDIDNSYPDNNNIFYDSFEGTTNGWYDDNVKLVEKENGGYVHKNVYSSNIEVLASIRYGSNPRGETIKIGLNSGLGNIIFNIIVSERSSKLRIYLENNNGVLYLPEYDMNSGIRFDEYVDVRFRFIDGYLFLFFNRTYMGCIKASQRPEISKWNLISFFEWESSSYYLKKMQVSKLLVRSSKSLSESKFSVELEKLKELSTRLLEKSSDILELRQATILETNRYKKKLIALKSDLQYDDYESVERNKNILQQLKLIQENEGITQYMEDSIEDLYGKFGSIIYLINKASRDNRIREALGEEEMNSLKASMSDIYNEYKNSDDEFVIPSLRDSDFRSLKLIWETL